MKSFVALLIVAMAACAYAGVAVAPALGYASALGYGAPALGYASAPLATTYAAAPYAYAAHPAAYAAHPAAYGYGIGAYGLGLRSAIAPYGAGLRYY